MAARAAATDMKKSNTAWLGAILLVASATAYSTAGFFVMVACILSVSSFALWTFYRQGWFR